MNQQRLEFLFQKYFDKTASDSERDELMQLLHQYSDEDINDLLKKTFHSYEDEDAILDSSKREEFLHNILSKDTPILQTDVPMRNISLSLHWIKYVAAAILLIGLGIYFYPRSLDNNTQLISHQSEDLKPGGNEATLTLADGSSIVLNDKGVGTIAEQGGIIVTKTADGQVLYSIKEIENIGNSAEPQYNTISTPRGGQYQVILPDGTHVWLNASSSLKYPVQFVGDTRSVTFNGEGYFEVAKNVDMPFKVTTQKEVIEVLGTHFNINSYTDEIISRTTLVEGKVKVSRVSGLDNHTTDYKVLSPGQQSVIQHGEVEVIDVNIHETMAWKNGEFMFNMENIETVMRKIARWYDVEVIYQSPVEQEYIWGSVSRFKNISEVLKVIEMTGSVHFKVEGRRIYVSK